MLDNVFVWGPALLGSVQDSTPQDLSAVPGGVPTEGVPAQGTDPAKGVGAGGGGSNMLLWMMPALLGVLVLTTVMGSRRDKAEKAKRAALMKSLGRNDRVLMTSGIIGSIVELKDDEVVVKVDDANNTRIRFTRAAVQEVMRKANSPESAGAGV